MLYEYYFEDFHLNKSDILSIISLKIFKLYRNVIFYDIFIKK
jgi:hypothetical protein